MTRQWTDRLTRRAMTRFAVWATACGLGASLTLRPAATFAAEPETGSTTPAEAAAPPGAATATEVDPDDQLTRDAFDRALDRLRQGEPTAASGPLAEIAHRAVLAERRAAATALLAYARKLSAIAQAGGGGEVLHDLSDGRTEFIVTSTLGAFYSGVVLVDVLDIDDVRPVVGTLLVTTGVGLTGAILGSRELRLRAADGEAYSLGAVWGATTGILTALAVDTDTSEATQLTVLGGVAVGAFAGLSLSRHFQPTRGQVNAISSAMVVGFASAVLGSQVWQPEQGGSTALALMWLGGLQVGTFAGMTLAPDLDWSVSRSRLTLLSGGVGGLLGLGVAVLVTGSEGNGSTTGKIWAGSALAGLWGGLAAGVALTADMAPDAQHRAAPTQPSVMVLPMQVRDGGGLALQGWF